MLGDDWTAVTIDGKPAAHFEHTVVVTENGPEILTMREETAVKLNKTGNRRKRYVKRKTLLRWKVR